MKEIPLTKGKTALVDDDDYEWLSAYSWHFKPRPTDQNPEGGYARRSKTLSQDGEKGGASMHRQIMGITDQLIDVDHENGDGLDNQRRNLRLCSRSDNMKNLTPRGASHYMGVKRLRDKWQAQISINKRAVHLGTFETQEQAALAYDKAALATGNKFYYINFPQSKTMKSYEKVNESTGEITSKYKYLEGHPRQYRFDAKEGQFNINGTEKIGRVLTFQPIAWRIFTDNILNMGTKNWAEIFFIDEKNCVSAVLFHGYSVDNVFRLIEPLYYDDLTLADVVITAVAEKKENNKIQPKGVYYIATFSFVAADHSKSAEIKDFVADTKIFRQETLTDVANIKTAMNYFNPFAAGETEELPAGAGRREIADAVEDHYKGDESQESNE